MNKHIYRPVVLLDTDVHPAAEDAMNYIQNWIYADQERAIVTMETLQSPLLSDFYGIKPYLANVCAETLRRIMAEENLSDRDLFGLAWTLRRFEDRERQKREQFSGHKLDTLPSSYEEPCGLDNCDEYHDSKGYHRPHGFGWGE